MQQLHFDNYVPGKIWQSYRDTGKLKKVDLQHVEIDDIPTREVVAISPSFAKEVFVDKTDNEGYTIILMQEAAKELLERFDRGPRLVMLSQARYGALEELVLQPKYYYGGAYVPFIPAYSGCGFDVRVYG